MKKYALILILFIIILLFHSISAAAAVSFYIGDRLVDLPRPLMVVNGNILLPASILQDYLLAQVDYNSESQEVFIEFLTGEIIYMQAEKREVLVNGVEQLLDVAPEISKDQIMIPLRFIADLLGFELRFDSEQVALVLVISSDMAEVISAQDDIEISFEMPEFMDPAAADDFLGRPTLKDIVYIGGPRSRVFIDIEGYASYTSYLLTDPDRLVIDLEAEGELLPVIDVGDVIINKICSEYFNTGIRIVFELNKKTYFDINPWPQGGLDVKFNYQIGDIGYYRDEDNVPRLWFEANEQPSFQKLVLYSPMRLVLDFQDTTLMAQPKELVIDDSAIRAIRISQYTPSVTRLVCDLETHVEPVEVAAADDRFEIVLFEGTLEEYQLILEQTQPKPPDLEEVAPVDELELVDLDQILKERIIVIDPGHGGSDPGTIGVTGVFEKDVVLPIGLKLGEYLEAAGALVVYTRRDDRYVSKFDRPKIAELANAELYISIHANSYGVVDVKGIETLYNPLYLENFRLAQTIQSKLSNILNGNNRGVRPRTDLAVLNNLAIPAVLVEVGFVSNAEEELLLTESEYQNQIAEGLFEGIQLFFVNYRLRQR